VHGVLHLTGMDHETDGGEMLALQAEIVSWRRNPSGLA
jgi:probable rRNA maturation factor